MGILKPDMTDTETRLTRIDNILSKSARVTRKRVGSINKIINGGDLAEISAAAGPQGALMLSIYNSLLDEVENATGIRPEAYIGHAENPTG